MYEEDRIEKTDSLDIIGWCDYCHDPVFSDDEFKLTNGKKLYHKYCWRQKHNYPRYA